MKKCVLGRCHEYCQGTIFMADDTEECFEPVNPGTPDSEEPFLPI